MPRRSTPRRTTSHHRRREAVAYLALTYALTLAVALALPHARVNLLLSVAVPTVVVALLTVTLVPRGRRRAVWAETGLARAGTRSWPVAVLVPVLLCGVSYAAAVALGVGHLRLGSGAVDPVDVVVSLVLGSLVVLGEEIGWRGFLLPRLQDLTGRRGGAVLTGFLHGAVHLPLILLATTYDADGPRWYTAPAAVLTIAGAGVFYAWLRDRSGSLWPVTLAHGTANTVFDVGAASVVTSAPGSLALVAGETGTVTWLAVGLLAAGLLLHSRVWREPGSRPAPHDPSDVPVAAAGRRA